MNSNTIDQTAVSERIRFLIRRHNMSQAEFAKHIGIDAANLSKQLNGRLPITAGLINRISADMGVSKRWLATGTDLPYAKPSIPSDIPMMQDDTEKSSPSGVRIPIYNIDVTAGSMELSRQFTTERVIGSMELPSVSRDSAIVRVNGDSMEPEILNGSYVAIRTSPADPECIFWGQIYVVVLEDYRMVKHVRRNADPNLLTLHSANPLYDDMEISRDKVQALYLVEAILNIKIQC